MGTRIAAVVRLALLYVFIAVVGILGGRIGAAAWLYSELGWTATWLEISNWGPTYEPQHADPSDDGVT